MNQLDFTGKTVLVVGGSSGIGNGIAQAFRAHGAAVHVWGTRERADDYAASEGSDLTGMCYEHVDAADCAAVESYQPQFGRLDVLVLAQGIVMYSRAEFSMPNFQNVLNVNLSSVMACSLRFEQMLAATRGALITISSTAAYHSTPGNPAYNASKAGTVGLTRTLGDTWAKKGIRVNGIAPGMVATKLTKITTEDPERLKAFLGNIPIGRLGTPDDIAGVALFLASPLSGYIVGQTIPVDGGLILR